MTLQYKILMYKTMQGSIILQLIEQAVISILQSELLPLAHLDFTESECVMREQLLEQEDAQDLDCLLIVVHTCISLKLYILG